MKTQLMSLNSLNNGLIIRFSLSTLLLLSPAYKTDIVFASGNGSGPCDLVSEGSFQNSIQCVDGSCTGSVTIVVDRYGCTGTDNSDCEEVDSVGVIVYSPRKTVHDSLWASCFGPSGSSCALCAAAAAGLCLGSGGVGCVVGAGLCTFACQGVDPCCDVTCEQDLTTRQEFPGGQNC